MGEPARWFIGAATTVYAPESGFEDRPELAGEVERMAGLFAGLGYAAGAGFRGQPERGGVPGPAAPVPDQPGPARLTTSWWCTTPGTGTWTRAVCCCRWRTRPQIVAYTAMPAADLTGRLLSGPVIVQKLLFILDTCHAGAAGRAMAGGAVDFLDRLRGLAATPSVGIVVAARPHEQADSGAFTQALAERGRSPRQRRP